MDPREKGERTVDSGQTSSSALRDLLGGRSEPITPEVAAEHAASRIIQAVREREKDRSRRDDNA